MIFLLAILTGIVVSCKNDTLPEPQVNNQGQDSVVAEAPALTQKVNLFIQSAMQDVYLWYKELPDIDIRYEFDPKAYFNKLLYVDDHWSYITDDLASFENSLQGIEKSYGYSLAFGKFKNTGTVFALVEFVYPNTPASRAGLKRGDIIIGMNNGDITVDNYRDLLNSESTSITLGVFTDTGVTNGDTISMTAEQLNLDPVVLKKVIDYDGHKIGYLFYAQYIDKYNPSLDDAFQYFKDQQITDLVIDLRYNPGGYTSAAQHLCSSVAPLSAVNSNSTLVTFQWNDKYETYYQQHKDMYGDQLEIPFASNVPVKLGLDHLYILTGSGTASASELTITGLKPYMDVTTVGDTTYGKYTASITITPEDWYKDKGSSYYNDFKNWGLQPIVIRYANSQGVTDFKDGFAPDILVDDNISNGIPLGDMNEPLLKSAIENITGTTILAKKEAIRKIPYTIFDRGFSKFDVNKREMIYDGFDKNGINPLN